MIVAYTDGSCDPGDRVGGWGWVYVTEGGMTWKDYGCELDTTNNRMELRAIIECLRSIPPEDVLLFSDSTYCLGIFVKNFKEGEKLAMTPKGPLFTGWIRGWLNSHRIPKNQDLVLELVDVIRNLFERGGSLTFKWVKGHEDSEGNNIADQLANKARIKMKD